MRGVERRVHRFVYRLCDLSWDEVRGMEPGFPVSRRSMRGNDIKIVEGKKMIGKLVYIQGDMI
jgi:hypothetical protein